MMTKIVCKEKVLVEQEQIGLNIKEAECNRSVADGFELERHGPSSEFLGFILA
jgi:hypothetical protein